MNKRKEEIIFNLYRFNFLTRKEIQKLLRHKNHRCLLVWLKELLNTKSLGEKRRMNVTQPNLYYLDSEGRSEVKRLAGVNKLGVKRLACQNRFGSGYQRRCLVLANIYIGLRDSCEVSGEKLSFYAKNELCGLKNLVVPHPDAYFDIEDIKGVKQYFFLDVFKAFSNKLVFVKRLDRYQEDYEDRMENGATFPKVILVVTDRPSFFFLKSYLPKITDKYDFEIYLTYFGLAKDKVFKWRNLIKIEAVEETD